MSIKRDPILWCDGCADWYWCQSYLGFVTTANIRKAAKKKGWSYRRRNGQLQDLCPACSALPLEKE